MSTTERLAIIGTGPAGLCAAKHMLALGHHVVVFEKGSYIGGVWVYQNDNGRSPAYRSLHINSEARDTGFRDDPITEDAGLFPSHRAMRTYLESYADKYDITPRVRFRSEVVEVAPAGSVGELPWRVRLVSGEEETFDRVFVANGHQGEPMHPGFAADFTGRYLHARDYEAPEDFTGQDVLVIGAGNSALDIAADVCTVTRSTSFAARSPVLIMPRMYDGVPITRVLGKLEKPEMSWPERRAIREELTHRVHGRMEDWGLTTPTKQTHPASHPTIFAHMAWGNVSARPGVSRVEGSTVHFANGMSQNFDVMIAATGYEIDLPFLASDLNPVEGHRIDLYRRMVHPDHPGLYFIGLFDVTGGANIRMMDIQLRWLSLVVAGALALPSPEEMRADYRREQQEMAKTYPDRPRYGLELDPREYGLKLRADREATVASVGAASPR